VRGVGLRYAGCVVMEVASIQIQADFPKQRLSKRDLWVQHNNFSANRWEPNLLIAEWLGLIQVKI